jgi:hypothetical protein
MTSSECFRTRDGLVVFWAGKYGSGTLGLELHESHVTEFRGVPGIRGELGIGDNVEVAHVFEPDSRGNCRLCHGQRGAARSSPSEVEE